MELRFALMKLRVLIGLVGLRRFRRSGDRWIWVLKSETLDNMEENDS